MTLVGIDAFHTRVRAFVRGRAENPRARRSVLQVRGKVLAFTCGLVALFVATNVIVQATFDNTHTRRSAATVLTELSEGLAATVAGQLAAGSQSDLAALVRTIALSSEVDDVYVFDRAGKIVAQDVTGNHPAPSVGEPVLMHAMVDRKPMATIDGAVVTAAAPIFSDEQGIAGYILLRGSSRGQHGSGLMVMIAVATVLLLVGGVAAASFSAWLVRPLESLTAATGRIADGDLANPAAVATGDEFGVLADGLNRAMTRTTAAISTYERLQRDLTVRRERAEAASQAKSDFLAKVGSELRTSLNAIIGFSDLLAGPRSRAMGDKTFTSYARDINRAGRYLLTLVTNILDYVQVDAGTLVLNEELCDAAQLVRSVAGPLEPTAVDRGVTLTVESTSTLPIVRCDRERLGKALANVLSIAIRATRAGGYVAVMVTEDGFGSVTVRISDNGLGLAADDIDPKPASSAPAANRSNPGAGLGFALARRIVEQHRGVLRIESYLNIGTVVTIRLPAVVDDPAAEQELARVS